MTTERIRLPRKLAKSVSGGVLAEAGRLHPAGAVSATLNMLPLSRVTMTLAEDDLPMQLHDLVEVYGQNGSIGVYRVTKITSTYRKNRRVELAHGLDVFSDATFTASEDFSGTVATFLQKVVNAQTQTIGGVKYWQLGTCADTRPWNKDIKYDNLMECLTEIAKTEEDYMFTFDQSTFPWTLNFVARDSAVLSEFRLSRNVENCQVTLDDSDLCTKLYLSIDTTTTTADGDTTTTTHELHEDTAAQAVWGVVVKTAGIKAEDVPDKAAWVSQYFSRHAQPALQINIDGWEFNRLTGETLDQMHLGRICRAALPDYNTTFEERIVSLSYPDLLRSPKRVTASLANKRQKAEGAFSDLSSQSSKAASTARENSKKVQNNQTQNAYKFRTEKAVTDGIQTILHSAGLEIDPITGVWLYASEQGENYALGASFKVQSDGISTLVTKTGINSLPSGTTSLYTYSSAIKQTADSVSAEVISARDGQASLSAKLSITDGAISQEVTNRQNADTTLDGKISVEAGKITQIVTAVGSNGQVTAASIVAAVNSSGSSVIINADKINLEGYVTMSAFQAEQARLTDLMAGNASASSLIASNGNFSNLTITNALTYGGYGNLAGRIISSFGTASESGGTITIPSTYMDGTSGPPISFSITDTQTYKNAAVSSVSVSLTGTPSQDEHDQWQQGYSAVLTKLNGSTQTMTGTLNVTSPYTAGFNDGKDVMGVSISSDKVQTAVSNTKSVTITAEASLVYNATTHRYTAMALAYGNSTSMASDTDGTSNHQGYLDGVANGKAAMGVEIESNTIKAAETSTKSYVITAGASLVYNATTHRYTATAIAYAGGTAIDSDTDGTDNHQGYSDGYATGEASVTVSSVVKYQADAYDTDSHNYTVYVRGTASNGATEDNSLTVNGASAYNAGLAAGEAGVTIGSVTGSAGTAHDTYYIPVTMTATASNNATGSGSVEVNAYSVYSAGYSAGYAAAPVNPTISQCYVSSFSVSRVAKYGDGYEVTGSVSIRVNFSNGTHTTYGPYSVRDVA